MSRSNSSTALEDEAIPIMAYVVGEMMRGSQTVDVRAKRGQDTCSTEVH